MRPHKTKVQAVGMYPTIEVTSKSQDPSEALPRRAFLACHVCISHRNNLNFTFPEDRTHKPAENNKTMMMHPTIEVVCYVMRMDFNNSFASLCRVINFNIDAHRCLWIYASHRRKYIHSGSLIAA